MVLRKIGVASILAVAALGLTDDLAWAGSSRSDSIEAPRSGSRPATPALHQDRINCEESSSCDRWTGWIAPSPPPGPVLRVLPEGGKYDHHVRDLQAFQACRESALSPTEPQKGYVRYARPGRSQQADGQFADAVRRWNGDIFWAPASASSNVVTRFGDEARAVFGPIPDGNCADGAVVIPLEVEGNIIDFRPNPNKAGHPLEFAHGDIEGNIVKWTNSIPKCDKPSLAGGNVTYCGLNSRLNRIVRGNVEWLFFCRKSSRSLEVRSDPYWHMSNTKFRLYGTIGFNRRTGEIVFFDGRKDRDEFDWSMPFVPPGGSSYSDRIGRAAAEALYDPTFQIQCSACHDNKNAYVIDPHARQGRVGYFDGTDDPRAMAFGLGDYLPETPRVEGAPFRVIGSGYTSNYGVELSRARTVRDPTGHCTTCHTLTTQITGQRFAADAVAQEPWISNPSWAQQLELLDEKMKYSQIAAHRTDWALRSGPGKIHPWMVPGHGNDLAALPPELGPAEWRKLSDCLWGAGGSECGYQPLYTPCPAPQLEPPGDGFEPTDSALAVLPLPAGETGADRVLRVSWRYLNRYGNVPTRDDVRFNLAVKETAIPPDGKAPAASEYPGMDEAEGKSFTPVDGEVGTSGSAMLIQNASYVGHAKWTEPTASTDLRDFQIDLPGICNRRYLVRILPKRFCFDQSDVAYSSADHVLYADVMCD
jgi:hypothetical protein